MDLVADIWNSEIYTQFIDERTRPAINLLSEIPHNLDPKIICDLGCGPGNSTDLLRKRFRGAIIIGIDNSLNMLKEAKNVCPETEFIQADIADFSPAQKIDLLFANASLQWLDNHDVLFPKLCRMLNDNGMIAIQMPNNFHAVTHQTTVKILEEEPSWRSLLMKLRYGVLDKPFYDIPYYYDLLHKGGMKNITCWETEYYHEMRNYQDIYSWFKGTGLRPVLTEMSESDQRRFSDLYIHSLETQYSKQENAKILLPFRRMFMIGQLGIQPVHEPK